jgi:MarR family transcriptional regulator, 2-MHQ and catechol-resistance regulon repressor
MADVYDGRMVSALARLTGSVRREFSARIREEPWALDVGMRPPAYGILQVVRARQPISQRALCDRIGIDPGDAVAMIDTLEHAGFVARAPGEHDRRVRNLSLTPAGAEAVRRLDEIASEVMDVVLAKLTKRERIVLDRLLAKAAFDLPQAVADAAPS